jgi:hypothetical protein
MSCGWRVTATVRSLVTDQNYFFMYDKKIMYMSSRLVIISVICGAHSSVRRCYPYEKLVWEILILV